MSAEIPDAVKARLRYDERLWKAFGVTMVIFVPLILAGTLASGLPILDSLMSALTGGLGVSVGICGVMAFMKYRKTGRVSRRSGRRLLLVATFALWGILLAVVAVISAYPEIIQEPVPPIEFTALEVTAILVATLFASFLIVIFSSITAFGAIALMSAVTRRYTPDILARVKSISERKTWQDAALAWMFGIPDTLDTRTLSVSAPVADDKFPRRTFAQAVAWELVLGLILAIYVAFNPLVLGRSPDSIVRMLGILGPAALLIPLVIVPWFIYTSVGATIRGMTKDFRLYDGIKARIFRSYIAVGTLVVFVRISLSERLTDDFLVGMGQYVVSLVTAALLFTFVYFNYFDRELTKDIIERYNELVR